uniref:Abasic site processing protein HMCES n=1 Tax=Cacopsylla melanoneura TaxID=428564 RepID=A0A8D9E4S1_9HEMI
MCGRTCCNLNKDIYINASCRYNSSECHYEAPEWKQLSNAGLDFTPSINCAPQSITPVLVSSDHFPAHSGNIMVPMLWGMIPPWYSGNYASHGLSTNNCRLENITTSKLYSPSLEQGKRCVVLCEGFYEWQTTKRTPKKQPYFVYASQKPGVKVESVQDWNFGELSRETGWSGPALLFMAGIFNKWRHEDGDWIYSYSILTMESNPHFSWLHHRIPAVLSTGTQVMEWLNYSKVSSGQALNMLTPVTSLQWHPVAHGVGNSRNKSLDCNARIDLSKTGESKSSQMMLSWLGKGKRQLASDEQDQGAPKKSKTN